MGAQGTITCTMCRKGIPVEFTRVSNASDGQVHMLMGMEPLEQHMRTCGTDAAASSAKQVERYNPKRELSVTPLELSGRVERFLNERSPDGGRHFVPKAGSRACTMCGMAGASCMALVGQNTREGCCPACMNGNTHRAPQDDQDCRHWATLHGAKS